ncbi:MAG: SWIM zinc finger domain-containing protein, partial [Actinomycetia bacterium]|nr:SWIM zinc finger domain-containing protein [Actinomycetes bacterium]
METEARWTADQVLALAPDAASRKAGARLATPSPWSGTGVAGAAVWGLCKGSGSTPYQTVVDVSGPAFRCSCPSRKFPCKHALGLLLLWAEGAAGPIAPAGAPEWVEQWTAARRKKAESQAAGPAAEKAAGPADPEAAKRRADRRAIRVEGGAAELEQRLTDLLRGGLAGADRDGYKQWDEVAARMVDAQAPGLAARVRDLGAVPAGGGDWPSRMLEETALLHLLARGYLGRERLPVPLAETVRTRVGFTVDSAELLAG